MSQAGGASCTEGTPVGTQNKVGLAAGVGWAVKSDKIWRCGKWEGPSDRGGGHGSAGWETVEPSVTRSQDQTALGTSVCAMSCGPLWDAKDLKGHRRRQEEPVIVTLQGSPCCIFQTQDVLLFLLFLSSSLLLGSSSLCRVSFFPYPFTPHFSNKLLASFVACLIQFFVRGEKDLESV